MTKAISDKDRYYSITLAPRDPVSGCMDYQGQINSDGYGVLHSRQSKFRTTLAHRWAWQYCNGPVRVDQLVLHKCGNRRCCNMEHLYIGSHLDVRDYRLANGNVVRGKHSHSAKFDESDVRDILHRLAYHETVTAVAAAYGVGKSAICDIKVGRSWGWLCV